MKQARRLRNDRWHQEVVTLTRVVLGSRSSLGVDPWRLVGESKKNTPEIRASGALLWGTKFSGGRGGAPEYSGIKRNSIFMQRF